MTPAASQVLDVVASRGAARVEEIAAVTGLPRSAVVEALVELESSGLVIASVFRVTANGRAAWETPSPQSTTTERSCP